MSMTLGDSPNAEFPCCCCYLRMLYFPMSLIWLRETTFGSPLRASSDELRVWERENLKCLNRCGGGIARAERDGTCAETRFLLSPKRTSPFQSVWASVQSTAGSRGVRISFSNAGYTTFGGEIGRAHV